jgi:hypothetical protein
MDSRQNRKHQTITPDGEIHTRTSKHNYICAVAVTVNAGTKNHTMNPSTKPGVWKIWRWSEKHASAESYAKTLSNQGWVTQIMGVVQL